MANKPPAAKQKAATSESTASPSRTSRRVKPVVEPRFSYTGNALAAQAQIARLNDRDLDKLQDIETIAPALLSTTGGYSRGVARESSEPRFLSFGSAESTCEGREQGRGTDSFITTVKATLMDVRLGRRVIASLLQAQLQSTFSPQHHLPEISLAGTSISGMVLQDKDDDTKFYPVEVTLSTDESEWPTRWDRLHELYSQDERFRKGHEHQFFRAPGVRQRGNGIPKKSGYVVGTIVEKITTDCPDAIVKGNTITLENYGTLYLGEILIGEDTRRLTLVRGKLGSPEAGDASLCAVESNGKRL